MENRPKIKVKKDPLDWIMEIIGFLILIAATGYVIIEYGNLPDRIPSHYGIGGKPDAYSNKSTIIVLLTITGLMFIGMYILNKFPHIFNYPTDLTIEKAPIQYKIATKLVRSINTVIVITFSYMIYSTIQTAYNNQIGLGIYFMPIFLISITGLIIFYLIRSFRAAKTT